MLHTKQDFIDCLKNIIEPLKDYYTPGCAGIKCGEFGVNYGEKAALMEGFSRVLWGLAPLWGGGHDLPGFNDKCIKGIVNGTDTNSDEYWGDITDTDQKMVEAAAIGLCLVLAHDKIWEPLNDTEKKNFTAWLMQMNNHRACDNNWKFFAVLVNLGLKNVGAEYDPAMITHGIERFDSFYRENGWYNDGNSDQADYYIAFAIHFYGLIYAKVMENEDPENSRKFKDRAMMFAKDFIYWFADDGSALAFGRSLTYRFAQCCFWSACVFAGIEPFSIGVMKGIIARNLEWWMSKPIFDNGDVLSVGYAYPNLNMAEHYNAFGSPYWALKSFLILALPDDHEFYSVDALPLPKLDKVKVVPGARMVIQRFDDNVVALTAGQWAKWNPTHCANKYSKFAYSSKYAFSIPRSVAAIGQAGADSMLAFQVDGTIFMRRKCDEYRINDDGSVYSRWSPFMGIDVETLIIPTDDGHIRKHKVDLAYDCFAYDCGFATVTADQSSITSVCDYGDNSETITINCEPNTNLMNPYTVMNAVKYTLTKGTHSLETKVVYADSLK